MERAVHNVHQDYIIYESNPVEIQRSKSPQPIDQQLRFAMHNIGCMVTHFSCPWSSISSYSVNSGVARYVSINPFFFTNKMHSRESFNIQEKWAIAFCLRETKSNQKSLHQYHERNISFHSFRFASSWYFTLHHRSQIKHDFLWASESSDLPLVTYAVTLLPFSPSFKWIWVFSK